MTYQLCTTRMKDTGHHNFVMKTDIAINYNKLQLSRSLAGDTITVKASKQKIKLVCDIYYNDDNNDGSKDVDMYLD